MNSDAIREKCSAQASVSEYFPGSTVLPERDAEGEAARDVRRAREVLQGPRGLSRTKTKQVPALLLLLQLQTIADPVAGVRPDDDERAL